MTASFHILVANQHGNNRGDEAAMRAMLRTLTEILGDVEFSILHQFRERRMLVDLDQPAEDLALILAPLEALGLAAFAACSLIGLRLRFLLGSNARAIIAAYERTDLVVSAPGGPYFGDLYWRHELVHWFYVFLALLYEKPLFLYAPSAGPFRIRWLNPIRRRLYRRFTTLCVREEVSAGHQRGLLGEDAEVVVTADSALQCEFEALPRGEFFAGERSQLAGRFIVAVSLIDYAYPGESAAERLRASYEEAMLAAIGEIASRREAHFLLIPQLYGQEPTDLGFLQRMAARLPDSISREVVDPALDAEVQQRLFAMADLHIASRYHPAIFGNMAGTPGLCIYYEHKAIGFMRLLGLERFAFDIRSCSFEQIQEALVELLEDRENIKAQLAATVPGLRARSRRTSELAARVLLESKGLPSEPSGAASSSIAGPAAGARGPS